MTEDAYEEQDILRPVAPTDSQINSVISAVSTYTLTKILLHLCWLPTKVWSTLSKF